MSNETHDDTTTVADLIAAEIQRGLAAPGTDVCGPLRGLLPAGAPAITINIETLNLVLPKEAFE